MLIFLQKKLLPIFVVAFLCVQSVTVVAAQEAENSLTGNTSTTQVEEQNAATASATGLIEVAPPEYFQAEVLEVVSERQVGQEPALFVQELKIALSSGELLTIPAGYEFQPLQQKQLLKPGMKVIVAKEQLSEDAGQQIRWVLADIYRLPVVFWIIGLFAVAVILIAKWQGLFSLIGMAMSLAILLQYTVPQILSGADPFMVSLVSCVLIATITLYVAHGWSFKSHIALVAILITLSGVALLASLAVSASGLLGLGSEEAFFLQFGQTAQINLQGLLLGGILLGALGVLDDITISQSAIVLQLAQANRKLSSKELFSRAMYIGKDHIASLVNTLFLAYIGANMALFILFYLNEQTPFWVALNSELIVEEIIRTIAGSLGLVLAVPLTSALAAGAILFWPKQMLRGISEDTHHHLDHRH